MITTAEAKTYMGVSGTSDDDLIGTLISYAEGEVGAVCGRELTLTTYTDYVLEYEESNYDGQDNPLLDVNDGYRRVYLNNYPITSLTLKTGTETISTANYVYNPNNGVITLFKYYDDSKRQFKATYVAGYSDDSCPNDLKLLLLDGVKALYANSGSVTKGEGNITSKKVGDYAVSYGNGKYTSNSEVMKTYLSANERIINKYRGIVI